MIPLFEEGEDRAGHPITMHPEPQVLTPDHAAEAKRLCEWEIHIRMNKRSAFTARNILGAVSRRFLKLGKPWLRRALPDVEIHRLVDQQAKVAGWEVRVIDMGDWRAPTLYYPSERALRAWLRKHLPSDPGATTRRRTKGKPGRPHERLALVKFALVRLRRKPRTTWAAIALEWEVKHPNDHVAADTVRSAVRRWQSRSKGRKPK